MEKLLNKFYKLIEVKKINDNLFELNNNVKVGNETPLKIYVKKEENKLFLTDKKNIVKNMANIYELTSKDVKMCINDVLNFYNFRLLKGEIFTEINEANATQRYYDFIMCYAQLLNMFIFFDDPNK